jgi:hypothetical protein
MMMRRQSCQYLLFQVPVGGFQKRPATDYPRLECTGMYVCMYVYKYMYICMYVCMYTYICIYLYIYSMYVCMYVCMYIYIYVRIRMYVCMHACMYTYIHTMYTNIHTCSGISVQDGKSVVLYCHNHLGCRGGQHRTE